MLAQLVSGKAVEHQKTDENEAAVMQHEQGGRETPYEQPLGASQRLQLDAVVQDYNLKCTKPMYKMDLERAQANLSCPPVP